MSKIHPLRAGEVLAIAVSMDEGGLNGVRIVQHELLDDGSSSRVGVTDLMESLKEWEPSEGVMQRPVICRRAV